MKKCYKCGVSKGKTLFYKDITRPDGLSTKCKECAKKFKSKGFRTKTQKYCPRCKVTLPVASFDLSSVGDGYQTACKTCRNLVKRISKYQGYDYAQFHDMMDAQDGRCKICQIPDVLVIDHDHKTGAVRGLICQPCNLGLGAFKDKERSLLEAIQYLRESKGLPRLV